MSIINKLSKTLIAFFVLLSLIISSTSVLASEIVGRLSVHWSPKHHSAKHAQIFADEVNKRAKGKLKIEASLTNFDAIVIPDKNAFFAGENFTGRIILGKNDKFIIKLVESESFSESALIIGKLRSNTAITDAIHN